MAIWVKGLNEKLQQFYSQMGNRYLEIVENISASYIISSFSFNFYGKQTSMQDMYTLYLTYSEMGTTVLRIIM